MAGTRFQYSVKQFQEMNIIVLSMRKISIFEVN